MFCILATWLQDRHNAMNFAALLKKNIFLVHEYFFLSTPAEKHDKGKGFKDVIKNNDIE